MPALSLSGVYQDAIIQNSDFKSYLEQSLRNPFSIDLKDLSLIEVILACVKAKSKLHPEYGKHTSSLLYNLRALEEQYRVTLIPLQVTDIFWGYFVSFCQGRGLKNSTINTMCSQLKAVLSWAAKYNATVSPTYTEIKPPRAVPMEVALTADDVSRIAYFDIDRFYANRRIDFRAKMRRVRDHFVLSCNLFQRYSDMRRITPECFSRNTFTITQQKTGNVAVVNIDKFAVDAKTTYRILERYGYSAPYTGDIGNYNDALHILMRDIGFTEPVRDEERINGKLVVTTAPKWKKISSHTARRTAITIGVLRGHNVHALKRCSGHSNLDTFDRYIIDE